MRKLMTLHRWAWCKVRIARQAWRRSWWPWGSWLKRYDVKGCDEMSNMKVVQSKENDRQEGRHVWNNWWRCLSHVLVKKKDSRDVKVRAETSSAERVEWAEWLKRPERSRAEHSPTEEGACPTEEGRVPYPTWRRVLVAIIILNPLNCWKINKVIKEIGERLRQ